MERYNLPVGGIEVTIGGREPTKLGEVSAVTTSAEVHPRQAKPTQTPPVQHPKIKPLRYAITRALILVGAFAALGNIPVHSKVYLPPPDDLQDIAGEVRTTLRETQDTQELNLPSVTETYAGYEVEALPSASNGDWSLHTITKSQTLEKVLDSLHLTSDMDSLMADADIKQTLSTLKADSKLLIQIHDKRLKQLIYATGKRDAYIVSRQDDKYTAKWDNELFEEQHNRIAFTIKNPFHYEANRAGLPLSVTRQLNKIFKGDVNFHHIAIGDQVSVIFEDYYYQSERIFTNNVLAAEFNHRGDIHQRIRFTFADGKTNYLKPDSDMELKQVAFSRYPLNGGRLSSGFGTRRHPVFGFRRMHTGTDFAAPHGTPIYATGSGVVRYVGRKGGYGKVIELGHSDGVSTLYGHMSQYQKGLAEGDSVKRGDVIGYVGSTGTSTGNHVHYEFKIDGQHQDPMTVALPQTGILTPNEMKEFKNYARSLTNQLLKLRETAAIDRNVRQQFGG